LSVIVIPSSLLSDLFSPLGLLIVFAGAFSNWGQYALPPPPSPSLPPVINYEP
jgi:hypothetical protein